MKFINGYLFGIDKSLDEPKYKELKEGDALNYMKVLIDEILNNPNKKQYKIRDENTQVISIILNSIKNGLSKEDAYSIANRLLIKEQEQQDLVDRLNVKIRKGSLFLSLVDNEEAYNCVLVKVDNNDYLDEVDTIRRSGLPYENKSFKQCFIKIDKIDCEITDIFLFDRNGPIADYWSNKFLELDELKTNEESTKKSFDLITNVIKQSTYKVSQADYTLLRNQTLGYFKTNENFNIEDFYNDVFGSYTPENKSIELEDIKKKINKKISENSLDSSFTIIPSSIPNRKIKFNKQVNDNVIISITGYDREIRSNIKSKEVNGRKVLEIVTTDDETFNSFNWDKL